MVVVEVVLRRRQVVLLYLFVESGGFHVVGHVEVLEMFDFSFRGHHPVVGGVVFRVRRRKGWF